MFKITGVINGEKESLTYEFVNGRGSVSGDEMAMFMFKNSMERHTPVGPVGQYMDRDIDEPLAALFMMMECFEEIISSEGDLPNAEELPEGAFG